MFLVAEVSMKHISCKMCNIKNTDIIKNIAFWMFAILLGLKCAQKHNRPSDDHLLFPSILDLVYDHSSVLRIHHEDDKIQLYLRKYPREKFLFFLQNKIWVGGSVNQQIKNKRPYLCGSFSYICFYVYFLILL